MFKTIDKNADGFISKEEYMSNAESKFSKKDADGDEKLTPGEIKNYHMKKREMHKGKMER